jgi:uncharacterized protein (TIGR03000 family)
VGHRGHGCCGSTYVTYGCYGGGYGCYGGGYGCYGGGYGCTGGPHHMPKMEEKKGEQLGKPKGTDMGAIPAPATIVVSLPADARLTIDGNATTSTGDRRVFVSPDLNPGQEYHYTLTAQITSNGQTMRIEKRIPVRAGQETPVSLTMAEAVAAR